MNRRVLVTITGRRRIGKSRLAAEFGKKQIFIPFSGLAPVEGSSAQDQRDAFAKQFYSHFKIPPLTFLDWSDALDNLTKQLTKAPTVILFDEISWMAHKDPLFISKLKNWWDMSLQEYPHLTLILCGSVSTWIEENIIKSTALFGRISLKIDLKEFSLPESYTFLKRLGFKGSNYEILKILSVTGGVPWYIEQINPQFSADSNIARLFLDQDGILHNEYHHIFHDLFAKKGGIYTNILDKLSTGMKTLQQLKAETEYSNSGTMSHYMNNLVISGFIDEHESWSFKSEKPLRQTTYRLRDNYLRFYLKYIAPRKLAGYTNNGEVSLDNLPGWSGIMGLQVENLLLNNRDFITKAIGTKGGEIVAAGPYYQKATKAHKVCQIDYLIQTRSKNLYLCEVKFSLRELDTSIIESIEAKSKALTIPRGLGLCPVLIHFGGVANSLVESGYFYRVLDINDLLESGRF
jgi:AAA+ ATPase superfamily predicted ATPase